MNGVIERVNILIKDLGLTPNAFAKKAGGRGAPHYITTPMRY